MPSRQSTLPRASVTSRIWSSASTASRRVPVMIGRSLLIGCAERTSRMSSPLEGEGGRPGVGIDPGVQRPPPRRGDHAPGALARRPLPPDQRLVQAAQS
ncbi:hypothetical protein [Streptosporangium vulgare]|uniref:hypothetical protein n=1 Tax=Streptosporangium vulgare TaxID=46190 RepID=UPI0031E2DD4D